MDPTRAREAQLPAELVAAGLDGGGSVELQAAYHAPCSPSCGADAGARAGLPRIAEESVREGHDAAVRKLASSHLPRSLGRRFTDFRHSTREYRPDLGA